MLKLCQVDVLTHTYWLSLEEFSAHEARDILEPIYGPLPDVHSWDMKECSEQDTDALVWGMHVKAILPKLHLTVKAPIAFPVDWILRKGTP